MTTVVARANVDVPAARRAMIDSQLRTSGVNEPWVLAAMASLPRETFVPEALRGAAYIDRAIPLGDGRWLAAPLVHARFLAEAAPTLADRALLVGDADGYLAALLRPLVASLDTLAPAQSAQAPGGPYTLMVIDGAIEHLPDALQAALGEGGRLVTGTVTRGVTRLAVGCKAAGTVALLPLAELGMPVLAEFAAPKRWSF
jgi:protein-L-isoaspartate(D-aspartate) O-methyltransferase